MKLSLSSTTMIIPALLLAAASCTTVSAVEIGGFQLHQNRRVQEETTTAPDRTTAAPTDTNDNTDDQDDDFDICPEEADKMKACILDKCSKCEEELTVDDDGTTTDIDFSCPSLEQGFCADTADVRGCCSACNDEIEEAKQCAIKFVLAPICPDVTDWCKGIGGSSSANQNHMNVGGLFTLALLGVAGTMMIY